jgi:seryl-tRNA synthetase
MIIHYKPLSPTSVKGLRREFKEIAHNDNKLAKRINDSADKAEEKTMKTFKALGDKLQKLLKKLNDDWSELADEPDSNLLE